MTKKNVDIVADSRNETEASGRRGSKVVGRKRAGSTVGGGAVADRDEVVSRVGPEMEASGDKKLHYHLDEMATAFKHNPDIEKRFFKAQKRSQRLQSTPNLQEKMMLYSLFQQSSFGDPPPIDDDEFADIFGAQKRDAWLRLKGRAKEQTMSAYVSYVEELGNKYGLMTVGEKGGETSLFG